MSHRTARVAFHELAAGGEAVGRDENGKTVFAPFAAPGDAAQVAIAGEKAAWARGQLVSLETRSPARVAPPCPQFRPDDPPRSCGGCAWQHVELRAQREAKRLIVQNALARLGGQRIEVEACVGGAGFGYRNKADFVLGHDQSGAGIGFFARESHDLVPAAACPIQRAPNEDVLRAARAIVEEHPQWVFDAASGRGLWRRLVVRVSTRGATLATLVLARAAPHEAALIAQELRVRVPHLCGVLARENAGAARLIWGRDFLLEDANDLSFRVAGDAFWQVNAPVAAHLARTALEMAQVERGHRALDLFCGAGFFALHLARAGAQVTGLETHRGAVRDARANAQANGLPARFIAGDAARGLQPFAPGDFDLVLLDPPRAGAAACLPALVRLAPRRMVYVSCDPATLARDARFLAQHGYELRRAASFDLFPQTAHVETAALFERNNAA